jgi:hypothetical protein
MSFLTPKYPKSDTPGATAITPVPKSSRRASRTSSSGAAPSGLTLDQLRHVAMNEGGRVERAGKYMLIRVETRNPFGGTDYSHQRYTQLSDGTWKAG